MVDASINYEHTSATQYADNYNGWVVDIFRKDFGRRMIEIGMGHGAYRQFFPDVDFYAGLDINADIIDDAKARNPGETYILGDIADAEIVPKLREMRLDTIVCFNVLEHVEDHAAALRNLASALVPGGKILLFVPALPALYTDMDRRAGHHRRYTIEALQGVAAAAGVETARTEYFNPIGGLGWWANKFARHDNLNSDSLNMQTVIFDRYLVPVSRTLNTLTRSFFGQSLASVITPGMNNGKTES